MSDQRWRQYIQAGLQESARVKQQLAEESTDSILAVAAAAADCLAAGGKVLLCGNGGSAADCQHLAAELVGRLGPGRERSPLPALALTTDTSALTAVGNDYGFDQVFSRQVEALGAPGDLLIAISTSGNSQNVVVAVQKARERGLTTVGFLGGTGGRLKALVDLAVVVPSDAVARIQEAHIAVGHIVCDVAERMLAELPSHQGRVSGSRTAFKAG